MSQTPSYRHKKYFRNPEGKVSDDKIHPMVRDNQVIPVAGVYDALSAKLNDGF